MVTVQLFLFHSFQMTAYRHFILFSLHDIQFRKFVKMWLNYLVFESDICTLLRADSTQASRKSLCRSTKRFPWQGCACLCYTATTHANQFIILSLVYLIRCALSICLAGVAIWSRNHFLHAREGNKSESQNKRKRQRMK